jgi:uncharacterized protein YcfJ
MTRKSILLITAICALAVIAVAGWVRSLDNPEQSAIAPVDSNVAATELGVNEPSYASPQYVKTISPAPAASAYAPPEAPQQYADRPEQPATVVTRRRPVSHSVAIVGGSAGAGAAIGAIAGGGKGAGIGALSGGAAGFIYDRLTHKKQVVVPQQ